MNGLSTKYNKAVVVALFNAASTLLFIGIADFGSYEVSTELQGAWATFGSALFAFLIPNKED